MATYIYEVPLGKLSAALKKHGDEAARAIRRGVYTGAVRAQAELKGLKEPRDRGLFAGAWKLTPPGSDEVVLSNSSPYAGILERGARPHGVSKAGREAIRAWVIRKGVLHVEGRGGKAVRVTSRNASRYEQAVDSVVWAIVMKLKREGQRPLWIVRQRLPKFRKFVVEEVERALGEAFGNKP